ncbi:MAG: sirohydrochlorin cobaltochelatase [Desulfatirhabdiaceae bacterium]
MFDREEGCQTVLPQPGKNTMTKPPRSIKPPIVIAAFGTTSHARKTYDHIDLRFQKRFPDHELYWAFSSRMVKDHVRKHSRIEIHSPREVLDMLYSKGHSWAVIQSLHVIAGHEFYRLVTEMAQLPIRTSIGLPLLCSYQDYWATSRAMKLNFYPGSDEEAVVLVGHGTDHPAWSAYLAFESILRQQYGAKIFVGLVDGEPFQGHVVDSVIRSGAKKVSLIPFTLVTGRHFQEDITGGPNSWQSVLENAGMTVKVETQGIGYRDQIVEIFADHIRDALSVIPESSEPV